MRTVRRWAGLLPLALLATLPGCGRDNGLPTDLARHLARAGIRIEPLRTHAPWSSRGGYLVVKRTDGLAARIVSEFGLEPVTPGGREWKDVAVRVGVPTGIRRMWGLSGRPERFRLGDGGQFENFYVVLTEAGELYLAAEYAYG